VFYAAVLCSTDGHPGHSKLRNNESLKKKVAPTEQSVRVTISSDITDPRKGLAKGKGRKLDLSDRQDEKGRQRHCSGPRTELERSGKFRGKEREKKGPNQTSMAEALLINRKRRRESAHNYQKVGLEGGWGGEGNNGQIRTSSRKRYGLWSEEEHLWEG